MPSPLRIKKTPVADRRFAERRHSYFMSLPRAAFRREQSELERQSPAQGMARDPNGRISSQSGACKIIEQPRQQLLLVRPARLRLDVRKPSTSTSIFDSTKHGVVPPPSTVQPRNATTPHPLKGPAHASSGLAPASFFMRLHDLHVRDRVPHICTTHERYSDSTSITSSD